MKIAVNTRFLLPNKLEGIGWVTYELLSRMVQDHPEDEFIFLFDRPFSDEFIFGDNVTPVILFPPARHPILWYLWFEFAITRALKKYQPDVFLSPDSYCSLRTSTKTVMITHDIAHHHFPEQVAPLVGKYYNYYVPKFLDRANHITTVSKAVKTDIIETYNIPDHKITVVHNACRKGFSPLPEAEQKIIKNKYANGQEYYFYVGAIHPRKNVHRIIEAFDQFKSTTNSSAKLLIGGRFAWQTGAVTSAYEKAKHQSDIEFLGYLSEEDLPKVMASAYAFVYPSVFEGFGLPILEAMHCDVPFITSNNSSLPEVAGEAGIKIEATDTSALQKAMERLWLDKTLYQDLIDAGKIQRQQFDWNLSSDRLYHVLKKVAGK